MKDYLYYKQHNNEEYDYDNTDKGKTPKERMLLSCIQCRQTYKNAYWCSETDCQLYDLKKKWMKRPHTCSKWFLEHRVTPYRITNISNQ